MTLYTHKPTPLFEARQINTPEDADAWVASLTDNELVSGSISFSNVRFEFDEDTSTVWLKYTRTDEMDGPVPIAMDTDLGGYAIANKDNTGINLWVEGTENFNRRYQPAAE